jgi:hypothetical protein
MLIFTFFFLKKACILIGIVLEGPSIHEHGMLLINLGFLDVFSTVFGDFSVTSIDKFIL